MHPALAGSEASTQAPSIRHGKSEASWSAPRCRAWPGIKLWATLRSLGRSGLARLIEHTCVHARHFADALAAAGFKILNDVSDQPGTLVSFGSSGTTRDVIARVQHNSTCWCAGTEWQGRAAMRISVSSWATTDADVDLSVETIIRATKAAPAAAERQTD